jgi:predicted metalloendopeptidase
MQKVIDFETELAKITTPSDDRRDEEKLYHSMSIAKLQTLAPFVGFLVHARGVHSPFECCFRFLGWTTSTRHLGWSAKKSPRMIMLSFMHQSTWRI